MKQTTGRHRLTLPSIGLASREMNQINEKKAIEIIHRSLELGGNFLDIADGIYQTSNELIVGRAVKQKRIQFVLSTKMGFENYDQAESRAGLTAKKEYLNSAVERSLKNLGTDYIDLLYLNLTTPFTGIEEIMEGLVKLVREGKIRYLGLSEASAETIRKAQKIHPVAALHSAFFLQNPNAGETGLLDTLKNHGIAFVADMSGRNPSPRAISQAIAAGYLPLHNPATIAELEDNIEAAEEGFQIPWNIGASCSAVG